MPQHLISSTVFYPPPRDVSADFHAEPATYPLARDITLFQVAGSAHCHNFASTRTLLWDRLARWIQALNPRP